MLFVLKDCEIYRGLKKLLEGAQSPFSPSDYDLALLQNAASFLFSALHFYFIFLWNIHLMMWNTALSCGAGKL